MAFKLPYKIPSLDDVDEKWHELYTETEVEGDTVFLLDKGKFQGIEFPDDVGRLRRALDRKKTEVADLKATFEGIDPEEAREALDRIRELEIRGEGGNGNDGGEGGDGGDGAPASKGPDTSAIIARAREAERREWEPKVEKVQHERDAYRAALDDVLLDTKLDAELGELGIPSGLPRKSIIAYFRENHKMGLDRIDEEEGATPTFRPYVVGELGERLDPKAFVETWARTDAAQDVLPPEKRSGGGGQQGDRTRGISNPWNPETFNLTEQGRITKENPSLAKRLKAAAGKA